MNEASKKISAWLSLFTSLGTLVCCALPSLFVALGLGAVVAGLAANIPALVWLTQRKVYVFSSALLLLLLSGLLQWFARGQACPIDAKQAEACERSRLWSKRFG